MRLKVCGMREPENIAAIVNVKPDYMGFIFWAPSRRHVSKITEPLPLGIKKTGVFVDASVDYIQSTIETHALEAVQLHGEETPAYCGLIKGFGVEVIKAFSIHDNFAFSQLDPYEKTCDFFLFDTKGELPGGNGINFDWNILEAYTFSKPFFLSGGIGPESLRAIKSLIKTNLPLYAIDVNSKFESAPGIKKIEVIKSFKDALYEL
ncbi:MAG: phosphoribosylanthranilate isomerase [Flavobacteriaceae bacterium]